MNVRVITNRVTRNPQGRVTGIDPDKNQSKRINWNDSSDRKWLMNHLHWAMHNSHEVALYAESN